MKGQEISSLSLYMECHSKPIQKRGLTTKSRCDGTFDGIEADIGESNHKFANRTRFSLSHIVSSLRARH